MNFIEAIMDYSFLAEFLYGVTGFLVAFFAQNLRRNIQRHKLKKLLCLSPEKTNLSIPTRYGRINNKKGMQSNLASHYVTYNEALVIYEIQKLMSEHGNARFREPQLDRVIKSEENLICIGGPMANHHVQNLFKSRLSRVKHKWQHEHDRERTEAYRDFIYIDHSSDLGAVKVGDREITYTVGKEGYILLARLVGRQGIRSENDFDDSEHGTVHIMYGVNETATLAAVKSLTAHRNELFRRLSHRKGHYLVIIKCDMNGTLDFSTYTDLTDEAFPVIGSNGGNK